MIATRFMELRKRRGLMIALILVTIGIPDRLPHDPAARPRLRAEVLRTGRRLRHLHQPRRRSAVRLRLHRGRHAGLHRRIGRPHRGDVPASRGHRAARGWPSTSPGSPRGSPSSCPWSPSGFTIVCAVCVFARPDQAQLRRGERAHRGCLAAASRPGPRTIRKRSSATSTSTNRSRSL